MDSMLATPYALLHENEIQTETVPEREDAAISLGFDVRFIALLVMTTQAIIPARKRHTLQSSQSSCEFVQSL